MDNYNKNMSRDFVQREMHDAVCSKCGKDCKVPFQPIPGRSIYCKDCYVRKDKY